MTSDDQFAQVKKTVVHVGRSMGEMRVGSGVKADEGKVRMELLPGDALFARAAVLTFGAKKYAARNWEKGISWGRVFGAAMRHLWAWWQGRGPTNHNFLFGDLDPETRMSHLWHAGVNIDFLIAYEMRGQTKFDDRPAYQEGMPLTQGTMTPSYGQKLPTGNGQEMQYPDPHEVGKYEDQTGRAGWSW